VILSGREKNQFQDFELLIPLLLFIYSSPPCFRLSTLNVVKELTTLMKFQARPLLTQALEDGKFDAIVDPKLHKDYDTEEMTRMIACAAACVRHSARHRPRMTQVHC